MCCHGNFKYKGKMNKRNIKIITNSVSVGKDLLKVANIEDTLVILAPTLSK